MGRVSRLRCLLYAVLQHTLLAVTTATCLDWAELWLELGEPSNILKVQKRYSKVFTGAGGELPEQKLLET